MNNNKLQDAIIFYNHFNPKYEARNYSYAVDLVVQSYKRATRSSIV